MLASLNPFPNKPWFECVCSTSCLKTLWEMEKLHVTSNFSFSHCFLPIWRTFLNPFPKKPWFLRVCSTSLLKTLWEKEKLLIMSNFSFSHSVFYPFGELSDISLNLKLSSASAFTLEKFKICRLGKGLFSSN